MKLLERVKQSIEDSSGELTSLIRQVVRQELSQWSGRSNGDQFGDRQVNGHPLPIRIAVHAAASDSPENNGTDSESSAPEEERSVEPGDSVSGADEDLQAETSVVDPTIAELDQQHLLDVEDDSAEQPATVGDLVALCECIDQMCEEQAELRRLFQSRIHSDEVQTRAFDRIHEELQEYKQNFVQQEMRPLLKDVIFCYDAAIRERASCQDDDVSKQAATSLQMLSQMLLDVLFKYEVEPIRSESDMFDRKTQQCVGTIVADDEASDKCVAERGLVGFQHGSTVLRREQVTVYKFRQESAKVTSHSLNDSVKQQEL